MKIYWIFKFWEILKNVQFSGWIKSQLSPGTMKMYFSSVFAFYLKISWYLRLLRVCDTIINVLGSFPDEKITSKMWTIDNIVTFSKPYTAKYYLLLIFHSIQNVSNFFSTFHAAFTSEYQFWKCMYFVIIINLHFWHGSATFLSVMCLSFVI